MANKNLFNVKQKLHIEAPGIVIPMSEYMANSVKKFPKLNEGIVKGVLIAIKAGEEFDDAEIKDKKQKAQLTEFKTQAKADLKASAKNRATFEKDEEARKLAASAQKEEQKAAVLKDKADGAKLLDSSLSDKKVVKLGTELVKTAATLATLGDKFVLSKEGELTVMEGAKKADFSLAFATLIKQNEAGVKVADSSAKTEAQLAFAAKKGLGEGWANLFSAKENDLSRIKKGLKVFEDCQSAGKDGKSVYLGLPLHTTRSLMEFKVTTAEKEEGGATEANAKNLEAKKQVLKIAAAKLKEIEPAAFTQVLAKQIVKDYKESLGLVVDKKPKFLYVTIINGKQKIWTSTDVKADESAVKSSILAIDFHFNQYTWASPGVVDIEPVGGPTEKILAELRKNKEADDAAAEELKPKAKGKGKGKKTEDKPAAPSKEDEIEEDEEEDEDEDEEEVAAPAPVKSGKKGAKPAPAPVEEEDEEEETEDEDEDEDEDDKEEKEEETEEEDEEETEDEDEEEEEEDDED